MADNTTLPTGSGGDTIRTIDRTTSKTQVIGLDFGGESGPESLVSATSPLPVESEEIVHILQSLLSINKAMHLTLAHMAGVYIDPSTMLDDDTTN
jgi:hypothetical protein